MKRKHKKKPAARLTPAARIYKGIQFAKKKEKWEKKLQKEKQKEEAPPQPFPSGRELGGAWVALIHRPSEAFRVDG